MSISFSTRCAAVVFFALSTALTVAEPVVPDSLESAFCNPPAEGGPGTMWFWMNGNVTKEGITADLEAMKRVGLSSALLFNVEGWTFPGSVQVLSPQWWDAMKYTMQETDRLGLDLMMFNCPGWSASGGPWNTPEHSMQEVVTSEQQVKGPMHFNATLPKPSAKLDFYRDIAVLAFRTPAAEAVRMKDEAPKITVSQKSASDSRKPDMPEDTLVMAVSTPEQPPYVQLEFAKPYLARTLGFVLHRPLEGGVVRIDVSDDGKKFRSVRSFWLPRAGRQDTRTVCTFEPITARFYRMVLTTIVPKSTKQITITGLDLSPKVGIDNLYGKALYARSGEYRSDLALSANPEDVVSGENIVDLTGRLAADGKLSWNVPAGDWTILRIGHTPNGVMNHPAPEGGLGLECDKLSTEAVDAHWAGFMGRIINETGPLAGKVFKGVELDSYEVGSQNWTPNFPEEFRRLRGYDLRRFLPVFSGRVVDSPEVTERFLWDFRRTIADLFAVNYAGRMAELARQNDMKLWIEPYGNSPSDDLQYGSQADVPMSEFWLVKGIDGCTRLASSIAHTTGRKIVAAEAFTAGELGGNKWDTDPYALKALGDAAFCGGVNQFLMHVFAHQPWTNRVPGMTMSACGTHFDRSNTWWEQGKAWVDYLKRCQWLLQQGQFAADICYYAGEDVPTAMYGEHLRIADLPHGYAFDACSADVLLNRMTVKDGRIFLPDGMSYRMLVLSKQAMMRPEVLRKIDELVQAGATIVGSRPAKAPGLTGYPECDTQVEQLANKLWNQTGAGVKDKPLKDVLSTLSLKPDFEYDNKDARFLFIHRVVGGADVYFVSNQKQESRQVQCTFRVSGKAPELWHADTGRIEKAPVYIEKDGRTTVPLHLDPAGSVFVVFREAPDRGHLIAARSMNGAKFDLMVNDAGKTELQAFEPGTFEFKTAGGGTLKQEISEVSAPMELTGPWQLNFPPNWGAPEKVTLDKLIPWTDHSNAGVKYFSGTAVYAKEIEVPADMLTSGKALYLDLGEVKNIAEVKLNGANLGILWKPPFRVGITGVAQPGMNKLEVRITNLWPNRLIGDQQLPDDGCRWAGAGRLTELPQWFVEGQPNPSGRLTFTTFRHWKKDDALLPSGLLGPVYLRVAEKVAVKIE